MNSTQWDALLNSMTESDLAPNDMRQDLLRMLIETKAEVMDKAYYDSLMQRMIEGYAQLVGQLQQELVQVRRLSITDQLTGLYNRQYITSTYENELGRAQRYNRTLAVVLIDIDYFKKVNDTYGHDVGDAVLKKLAVLLRFNIRKCDILARWGGEEFLLLIPETDHNGCKILTEKLRAIVEKALFPVIDNITVSMGAALSKPGDTTASLLKTADSALYLAKKQGRNQVVMSS
jgi:diguanylate cyclase (GGDEF)-like protein